MNVTYSNCYLGEVSVGDMLITDELAVAQSLPGTKSLIGDAGLDPDVAEAQNALLWRLAFEWFRDEGEDPTVIEGISAGDIAGTETAITILLPAARGVLEGNAWLDLCQPTRLTTVVAEGGQGHYNRVETVQAEASVAALRQRVGDSFTWDRAVSGDPRNARLFAKYALTRDLDWLQPGARWQRLALTGVLHAINLIATLRVDRGRRTLVVHEYNPTRAFARRYSAQPAREYRLVRSILLRDEVWEVIRAGDRALLPFPHPRSRIRRRGDQQLARAAPPPSERISARFTFGGVDLWPILQPHLTRVIERYGAFVARAAPAYRAQFERLRPDAVLVPFDAPPEARLLVRIAQRMDIPTFVMNDGFKSDSFELDCMTADHALAWSAAIAEHYLVRRTHGRIAVTGNPKADVQRQPGGRRADRGSLRRILVGGFAFSPVDLNCRRSDPERFLDQVLAGIEQSHVAGAEVIVKLHPADRAEQYADILRARANLAIELISEGDVVDRFARADVYVTGPSTSLLEALASGMPVIYYRVNQQHLHPPFSDDPFIERRTAASPQELAAALDGAGRFEPHEESQIAAWSDYYLGPRDGRSVARMLEAMQREFRNG